MTLEGAIIAIVLAVMSSAIIWLFKTVIDVRADISVIRSQRESYLRELDQLHQKVEKLCED